MCKPEARTFTHFRINAYLSVHLFYKALTDGKSQSCTVHKRIQFDKTVEDRAYFIRRDTDSRITHIKLQFRIAYPLITYFDASFRGELQRIVYKVGYDLYQTVLIAINITFGQMFIKFNRYKLGGLHAH